MKIICVGMNYTDHIRELNNQVPEEPVIFFKPDSALLRNNDPFFIPGFSNEIHHEVELVVKICRVGKHIDPKYVGRYYKEIGLGIDFTARDLQAKLRSKGLPWEKSKGFDQSAAISKQFIPIEKLPDPKSIKFRLDINGQTVQSGDSSWMIFPIDEIIVHVSKYFTLKMGDLIYTGTPVGVGPVRKDDRLEGYLEGEKLLDFFIR